MEALLWRPRLLLSMPLPASRGGRRVLREGQKLCPSVLHAITWTRTGGLDQVATPSSGEGSYYKKEIMDTNSSHTAQPMFSCYVTDKSREQGVLSAFAVVDNRFLFKT